MCALWDNCVSYLSIHFFYQKKNFSIYLFNVWDRVFFLNQSTGIKMSRKDCIWIGRILHFFTREKIYSSMGSLFPLFIHLRHLETDISLTDPVKLVNLINLFDRDGILTCQSGKKEPFWWKQNSWCCRMQSESG